ncbi:MAG: metallophosphoesterase [Promethearchaeota archaeon]
MAKIFAISDLHLPIHIQIKKFKYPVYYYNRIIEHLEKFKPDLLIIAGDFSYENNYRRGLNILFEIKDLPGIKKVFIEGNHDTFCHSEEIKAELYEIFNMEEFYYLSGRAIIIELKDDINKTKRIGLCGAMGWMFDQYSNTIDDEIMLHREYKNLKKSLDSLQKLVDKEGATDFNICVLHHPPTYQIFTDKRKGNEMLFNLILVFMDIYTKTRILKYIKK